MLYPLELRCNEITSDDAVPRTEESPSNDDTQSKPDELKVNALEFRPKRTVAITGSIKVNVVVANKTDGE